MPEKFSNRGIRLQGAEPSDDSIVNDERPQGRKQIQYTNDGYRDCNKRRLQ